MKMSELTPLILLGGLGFLGFVMMKKMSPPNVGPQFAQPPPQSGLGYPPPSTASTGRDLDKGDFWDYQANKAIDAGLNMLTAWATAPSDSGGTGTGYDDVDWDSF